MPQKTSAKGPTAQPSRARRRGRIGLVPLAALLALAPAAGAQTPPATMGGETFFSASYASTGELRVEGDCRPVGEESTLTFTAEGEAIGPYAGTYTETGTVKFVADDPVQWGGLDGPITGFSSTFTVRDAAGDVIVEGSKSGPREDGAPPSPGFGYPNIAYCYDNLAGSGLGYGFFPLVSYDATIQTASGTYRDEGDAQVQSQLHGGATTSTGEYVWSGHFIETFVRSENFGPAGAKNLALSPAAATNDVGTDHTVTATATDGSGDGVEGVVVRFSVEGAVNTTGQCTTGADGTCTFTYTGPHFPGADLITAYADNDEDGQKDADEPASEATKAWVLPTTAPGHVTGGGQLPGGNVAFGFNAKGDASSADGRCNVVDKATDTHIKCLTVDAILRDGNHVRFYGTAEVNGVEQRYRIDITDNGEPGATDEFAIVTSGGYSAGGTIARGNIQVH